MGRVRHTGEEDDLPLTANRSRTTAADPQRRIDAALQGAALRQSQSTLRSSHDRAAIALQAVARGWLARRHVARETDRWREEKRYATSARRRDNRLQWCACMRPLAVRERHGCEYGMGMSAFGACAVRPPPMGKPWARHGCDLPDAVDLPSATAAHGKGRHAWGI
jgi:hypothetical protein